MKTFKQFNEESQYYLNEVDRNNLGFGTGLNAVANLAKALKSFGSRGIRKTKPNVEFTEFGKTTKRFNPDLDGKQFNRTQNLKSKYRNVDTDYKKGLMMKQKMVGVQRGTDPMDTVSSLKKEPVLKRLARQRKSDMFDANVNLQRKYTARRKDAMQGFKPTESGPNTAGESKLSTGKGTKKKKRMLELLLKRIKK